MPDDRKPRLPEINFLPPLRMVLAFFDRSLHKKDVAGKQADDQEESIDEKDVEKLIEKLSEKEE